MMKKVLYLLTVMLILTGCGRSRSATEAEETTEEIPLSSECNEIGGGVAGISKDLLDVKENVCSIIEREETEETAEALYDWQIEFTEEMIQELPDIPDWNSADAYISFLEGYKPSDEILKIYEQKKEADELFAGYLHIYYQAEEISYIPPYYEEELYSHAIFKQNDCLVIGHQADRRITMTYSDGHSEEIGLDIIPENCILLTPVSVYEGHVSEFFEGFSICYDQVNSEVVCVRFDEEIGKRVKISSDDIEEFLNREEAIESYPFLSIGYINHNNELVYPTIIEDETGIRFELLKEALEVQKEQLIYFSTAIVDNINFKVFNDTVYIIDNVKRRADFDGSEGFCYGIWTTGEAKIKKLPINYSQVSDVEIEVLSWYDNKEIEVCIFYENIMIFGKDTYMYQGQFKNDKFQKYLFDEGVCDIGLYCDISLSTKYDNWKEAEPTLVKLKEGITKEEAEN